MPKRDREWAEVAVILQTTNSRGYRVHQRIAVGCRRTEMARAIQQPYCVFAVIVFTNASSSVRRQRRRQGPGGMPPVKDQRIFEAGNDVGRAAE